MSNKVVTGNEAREAVWDLRHSGIGQTDGNMEQPADVVKTLESYARQVEASEGIPVRADFGGVPAPLGSTADRNLLLVAREAIRNAVAHGHPAGIHVSLRFDPLEVRLEVEDDSARHHGHAGATPGGESHFNVAIEAAHFKGLNRVARQRAVLAALAEELAGPVHALSIKARAPGEAA